MKKRLTALFPYVAALFLGILLMLAFAPYEIFPFSVIALAGLLLLWLNTSSKQAFWLGFLFGIGLFGSGVYWVYIGIHDIGQVPWLLSLLITGSMIAILALYPAVCGYFLNRFFPISNAAKILCAFPAIWVFSEWVRSWLFTGFPWFFLGYSQTNSPLKGFAPILGVYGISLAIIMSAALLVYAWQSYQQKIYKTTYFSLFAILSIWVSGALLNLIPWTYTYGKPLSVSLVQGAIPQVMKWSPENVNLSLDRYAELTQPLLGKEKLIIWPEAAIPLPLQQATDYINSLDDEAKASGTQVILGIPIQAVNGKGYYNAVVAVGQEKNVYLKRRLVPFGEYTPFSAYLSRAFNFLNLPLAEMMSGETMQKPMTVGKIKLLVSICYEIGFPDLIRSSDKSVNVLLTVTNDAWFGRSNAQAQHLQMAMMRALEMERPVLFVSNDGITAIIGPHGNLQAAAPPYQPFVLTSTVQPRAGMTPWMQNGSDPLLFILICLLFTARRLRNEASIQCKNNMILTQ